MSRFVNHFYDIETDDRRYPKRWFLDEPRTKDGFELEAREFCYGRKYSGEFPHTLPIDVEGPPVAFHLAAFDMPVVTSELAEAIEAIAPADIQRFPVFVDGYIEGYEILNVISTVDCLDRDRSEIEWWTKRDRRPDKVGKPRMIIELHIDPARVGGHKLFRIKDWEVALIVDEDIKRVIEGVRDHGVVFELVS